MKQRLLSKITLIRIWDLLGNNRRMIRARPQENPNEAYSYSH